MTDLSQTLRAQQGLITRAQSLGSLSAEVLRRQLANEWSIALPGVYAESRDPLSPEQRRRAALLYGGPCAQLADVTALADWGVDGVPVTDQIYLLIPAVEHRMNNAFVSVRRTHRLAPPTVLRGFPYCSVERALVETSARLGDLRTARALIADAVARRVALTDLLRLELPHLAGRGAGIARHAVSDILLGARSAPECEFFDLCRAARGLPDPWLNALLELPGGRLISPDGLWVAARLVHEVNSRRWHAEEDLFESTQERADAMTTAGLIVLSNTPRQIRSESGRIMSQIRSLYEENQGRGLPPGVRIVRDRPL